MNRIIFKGNVLTRRINDHPKNSDLYNKMQDFKEAGCTLFS